MSSLGIFDKETKTYKKVADLSKPAVIDSSMSDSSTNAVQNKVVKSYVDGRTTVDSEMSDTSTNPVQNKVVKSYVDGRTTLDTAMSDNSNNAVQNKVVKSYVDTRTTFDEAMSDTSTNAVQNKVVKSYVDTRTTFDEAMSDTSTNPVQNKVVKSYVDGTFKRKSIAMMWGDGKTSYCQLCTIKISNNIIDTPIEITVQERVRSTLDRLTVLFQMDGTIDPPIASFKVFGECGDWYISKRAASTWVIYGSKNGPWANIRVVDYIGTDGIDVTWDVTGVTTLPDSKTKAVLGGNVSHAISADNASSASTVNGHTVNSDVPSGAKFTDTDTWRPLGTTADTACAGNDSRLSNARPASDVYAWAKASSKPSYSWNEITSKPSTFTPASHTHTKSQITDFPSSLPANGGNSSTVNGHTVNSDVPSGAKFTDTTYNDATTSAHGLMTPSMVSKLNGIADGANRTIIDSSMSGNSTNPVQNKVVNEALQGRANNITFNSANNTLSLRSGETVLKEIGGIQTGYYVGSNPPKNTDILWIDSLHGGMVKYFASDTSKWHPVRAKGYDTPVDLIHEGYWHYSLGPGITVENISAIYDINTDKVTIIINNLSITSEAFTGPNEMVYITMPMYNLGHTGSIKPVKVIPDSGSSIDMAMILNYPHGSIQTGPPYGIYKPATMRTIEFEISHPPF